MLSCTVSKIRKIFTGATYALLLSFTVISDIYRSFIPHKTTFTKHCFIPQSFEILVNFTGLVGIVNATVYQTEPIFTGHGHGKSSWFLTLHVYCNTKSMQTGRWFNIRGRKSCFRYEWMLRLKCYSCFCQTVIHHGKILLTDAVRRDIQIIINIMMHVFKEQMFWQGEFHW